MSPLLEIRDLRLAFDGFEGTAQVLDGIDLAVGRGETVGIVGETGCGKSVLARQVLRLNPTPPARVVSGAIRFDGLDVLGLDAAAMDRLRGARIAMIFQDPMTYLNPLLTIGVQVGDVVRARDRSEGCAPRSWKLAHARATELLAAVRMPDPGALLCRHPHELSGGMRQRVLIAMALAGHPELLIADEPTTALDVTIQAQVLALISDLVARMGLTLLLISHDLGVVGAMCRRIVVMYAGTIVEDGPAERLLAGPRHPYTQGLLAAIPDIAHPERRPLPIAGTIPSLIDPPAGCRFAPRCHRAIELCRSQPPRLEAVADGRRVACHRVSEA